MDWLKLYKMKLGEMQDFGQWIVLRVPGGWIFSEHHAPNASYAFVPFDNEFQQ